LSDAIFVMVSKKKCCELGDVLTVGIGGVSPPTTTQQYQKLSSFGMTNSNSDLQLQRRALGNRRRRTPSLSKSLRLMLAFAFTVQFISPAWQMRMLHLNDGRSPSSSSTSSRLLLRSRRAIPTPKIYDDVRDVPRMTSTGPIEANDGIGGLYHFTDVCLTKHHLLNENLQGVIYFQPDNDELLANELRCVPCSAPLNHGGGWDGEGRDEKAVRHKCGFTTAHAMVRNIHRCFAVTACSSTHKRPRVQSLLTTFQNGLNVTTNPLLGIS
jgi:hypothetical protein